MTTIYGFSLSEIKILFSFLSSGQLVGYCLLSHILFMKTDVMIEIHTPARKIPICFHVLSPEENTIHAAPAGGWIIPNLSVEWAN